MTLELWRSSSLSLLKGDDVRSDEFGEHNEDEEDEYYLFDAKEYSNFCIGQRFYDHHL